MNLDERAIKDASYLAIDPGERWNGLASFDKTGDLITMWTIEGINPFTDWLEAFPVGKLMVIIVEDYRLDNYSQRGIAQVNKASRVETAKTIGRIESWAYRSHIKLVLQPNSVKPTAYMWAGITVPKKKELSHETDAYVHGVHWLQKVGIRRPQQARRTNGP